MNSKQVYIPEFDVNTHFWLLRAEGGKYFEDFIDDSYVGIRYNNVHVDDVLNIKGIQSVRLLCYRRRPYFQRSGKKGQQLSS